MCVGYFVHTHTVYEDKCRVFTLTQLNLNQRQRLWALMDTHTRQPLLYPLVYHYILATPALALIRAKALGTNPVWQNMVAMMLTGELVPSKEWQGRRVVGMVGDRLHYEIGGCARADEECPFCEVRCCYGCLYYRPFLDGHHQDVNGVGTDEKITLLFVMQHILRLL